MKKNIILIPPCFSYGDCQSVIGLLYYLLEHYQNVYFYIKDVNIKKYYELYFSNDKLFNVRIFLIDNPIGMINNGNFGEYHICNTLTDDWSGPNYLFFDLENINKDYYFNDLNPLYNKLKIDDEYKFYPNKHLPPTKKSINHIFYYELLGLNNNVRMDYFNYSRNLEKESIIKKEVLNNFNCGDEYNIVNDPIDELEKIKKFIDNDYPIINISNLSDCIGDLILLVEGAKTINFIESNNANFFYHSQYKGIFNCNLKINLHVWLRDRDWENYKLDNAWKMMNYPKLENWNFIF